MKYTFSLATFLPAAYAASFCTVPQASTTSAYTASPPSANPLSGYFGVVSSRSASPIHLQELTARGGKFYIGGGPPSSYCPPQVGDNCPPGNSTVLAGGQGTLALGVVVPGGQQVYVAPDGSLSYTVAHSAYIPEGSVIDGFNRSAPTDGSQFGYLTYATGFSACPVVVDDVQQWQVYGEVGSGSNATDCLGFSALSVESDEPGAWQY